MNRLNFIRALAAKVTRLILLMSLALTCGLGDARGFDALYDYFFPKKATTINGEFRRIFDECILADNAQGELDERLGPIYRAFRGDERAFHAFVNSKWRMTDGEFGETWTYACLLLLLRLGDDQFAKLLSRENEKTREAVGMSIDPNIDEREYQFPKTRAMYRYRYAKPTASQMAERHRSPAEATIPLNRTEEITLRTALAVDDRFTNVSIYRPRSASGVAGRFAIITVLKPFTEKELAELERFINATLHRTDKIAFDYSQHK